MVDLEIPGNFENCLEQLGLTPTFKELGVLDFVQRKSKAGESR